MINLLTISLENEMDLVLSHKRSMKVAAKLGLTLSTQTTFSTAVSEIARTVIEHTDNGLLVIGLEQRQARYALIAHISFEKEIHFTNQESGFYYAQKLVPEFNLSHVGEQNIIEMKIGLPRSLKLDPEKIASLKTYFVTDQPLNAYEEIKERNISLNRLADEKDEELRQSKLIDEKKTEFISVASHEIKTPMTVLKAYTQMARDTREPISDRLRSVLEKIDLQSTKLMQLVHQLMDISKIENGNLQYNFKTVQLNNFLISQLSVMKHILPSYEFFSELSADVQVSIDELRMEQVFANLLGNAAKYSAVGSHITVRSVIEKGAICIGVNDQGKGISKENLHLIFEKFFRTQDVITTHAGLGMGLFITSKIITDHGGKIWAESEIGNGSTFFFTQPLPFKASAI